MLPNLELWNVYGATETSGPVALLPPELACSQRDKVGLATPGAELVIMDESGQELPPGEAGEIWIKGPMVVPGYWQDEDATAANIVGGFWRSGDIGSMTPDGLLAIVDRKKDMINRGGYKVYSAEVENALLDHPSVLEAAVVGRVCPVLGEGVHAVITLRPGALDI